MRSSARPRARGSSRREARRSDQGSRGMVGRRPGEPGGERVVTNDVRGPDRIPQRQGGHHGRPACAVCSTHIAISGQSLQSMFFWSGQQGISADADMSVISATGICAAAAGAASGATARPAVTKTASARLISRRRFMPFYPMGRGRLKGRRFHIFASEDEEAASGSTELPARNSFPRRKPSGCAIEHPSDAPFRVGRPENAAE